MLIKPFYKEIESVSDIPNITQKARYLLIYRYSSPHNCSDAETIGSFNDSNDVYDIFLINDSIVDGINYLIPKNIILYNRNCYRGYSKHALLPDGKTINYKAPLYFLTGTYSNTIHRKNRYDPLIVSSYDILSTCGGPGETGLEDELMSVLHSEYIQPFPQFYNIEDQARLSQKYGSKLRIGDFLYDFNNMGNYVLGDLIDEYTRVAIIDMPNDANIINMDYNKDGGYSEDVNTFIKLNNGKMYDYNGLKSSITQIFINISMIRNRTNISAFDLVIDLEEQIFNIPYTSIKMKYVLPKEEIINEYKMLCMRISEIMDNLCELTLDVPDSIYVNNMSPNKLTMHFSNTESIIKLSNTYYNVGKKNNSLNAFGKISSSDTDDLVSCWAYTFA